MMRLASARSFFRRAEKFGRQSAWTHRLVKLEKSHRSLVVRSIVIHTIDSFRYLGESHTPPLEVQSFQDDEDGT